MAFGLATMPVSGAVGGGSVLSGAGISSSALGALAMANPYLAVASAVISALSAPDISKAGAQGMSSSGLGVFEGENTIKTKKPIVDFSSPWQVATLSAVVIFSMYAIKRLK